MFSPDQRLTDEIAAAIDTHAPAHLRGSEELIAWAVRRYVDRYLIFDEAGRGRPLSPDQIRRGAEAVVSLRDQRAHESGPAP